MRDLIERLLREAVKEQIERLFTYRNLQAVRDKVVKALDDMTGKTVTVYDDIIWRIARRLLDDDNLAELYNWVKSNCAYVNSIDKTCKAPAIDFAGLQDVLQLTDTYKLQDTAKERAGDNGLPTVTAKELCAAAIPWATVVEVLRVIVPIFIEWYNKQ